MIFTLGEQRRLSDASGSSGTKTKSTIEPTTVGSDPSFWYGLQTAKGDGALVQPILAYGYQGDHYTIFNGVFDWTPGGGWHTSPKKLSPQ